jgi:hypothetical protein
MDYVEDFQWVAASLLLLRLLKITHPFTHLYQNVLYWPTYRLGTGTSSLTQTLAGTENIISFFDDFRQ